MTARAIRPKAGKQGSMRTAAKHARSMAFIVGQEVRRAGKLAQPDPIATFLKKTRGALGPDHRLDI